MGILGLSMATVTISLGFSKTAREMDKENKLIIMDQLMKEIGLMGYLKVNFDFEARKYKY